MIRNTIFPSNAPPTSSPKTAGWPSGSAISPPALATARIIIRAYRIGASGSVCIVYPIVKIIVSMYLFTSLIFTAEQAESAENKHRGRDFLSHAKAQRIYHFP